MRKIKAARRQAQVTTSILVITVLGDIIDFPEINLVSCRYPLLYQIYLDVKKGGGGESNLLCKDVLEDDKNVLKTLVLFLFNFI